MLATPVFVVVFCHHSAILAMMNTISTRESPLPTCQLLFLFKGLLDHVSDQENLTASQKVGDNECCQCRYKYHSDTADHTRDTQTER